MRLIVDHVTLSPGEPESNVLTFINKRYSANVSTYSIIKKSLDARNKHHIVYRYRVLIEVQDLLVSKLLIHKEISQFQEHSIISPPKISTPSPIIIIGSGPAGLFCALRLIEAGATVCIFERGKRLEERHHDIQLLETRGILNPESNVLFGEGGAGTYSDGKLTSRSNRPEINWFYRQLIKFGGPESITYDAKPHLGTDTLSGIIKGIRTSIISHGSTIHFNEGMTDLLISKNKITGITTTANNEFNSNIVVLATGHSCRDTYLALFKKGIHIEKKGFAAGFRIEHPRELIDGIQYGYNQHRHHLPAAEYAHAFTDKLSGKGIYTFCMCPGGKIINASSEENGLCVNGMSYSKRNLSHSNAALIVSIGSNDLEDHVLAGIDFQRKIEENAYNAGGGNFFAPAQRVTSFLSDRLDDSLPISSYCPGVKPSMVNAIFPDWMTALLKKGLLLLDNKMKGYIHSDGLIIAAETRTSSPIRISRTMEMQSSNINGLYPIGEGAGYSGGIVSSAIDGIRAADSIISRMQ